MAFTLFSKIGGHCSFLNSDHEIEVYLKKKHFVGHPRPVHIPTGFKCSRACDCQQTNECPLWKTALKMNI